MRNLGNCLRDFNTLLAAKQLARCVNIDDKFLELPDAIWQKCQLVLEIGNLVNRTLGESDNACEDRSQLFTAIGSDRILDLPFDDDFLMKAAGSMPCIFYECTLDLTITAISPNIFQLIGIRSDDTLGKKAFWQERLTPPDRCRLLARIDQLESTAFASEIHKITDDRGLPVWVANSFRKASNGYDLRIRGCIVPLPAGFGATAVDNTVISQFVHKIGNHFQLMNFVIGSLQRSGMNAAEIETLQQTVDRAVEFTRGFSHYVQSISGFAKVELCELLRTVIASMAPVFREREISLTDLVAPLDGVFLNGDGFLLDLAFRAVLQNALDATKNGDLVVLSGRTDGNRVDGRSVARIGIVDTGSGIDRELLGNATEPFVSSKRDGDGLGLSTAVRIVEMHGGVLKISSKPGEGTEVEILLPINHEAQSK